MDPGYDSLGGRKRGLNVSDELDSDLKISRGKSWEGIELCMLVQSPEPHFWVRQRQFWV